MKVTHFYVNEDLPKNLFSLAKHIDKVKSSRTIDGNSLVNSRDDEKVLRIASSADFTKFKFDNSHFDISKKVLTHMQYLL